MAISSLLAKYLADNKVSYEVLTHPEVFTAQEVAHVIHHSGKVLAKAVIVEVDGTYWIAVVPAHHKLDFAGLKKALKAENAQLVPEERLRDLFPDSQLGAMPPIGSLYGLDVIISHDLTLNPEIIFNGGTHRECVKMGYAEYEKIVKPKVGRISYLP